MIVQVCETLASPASPQMQVWLQNVQLKGTEMGASERAPGSAAWNRKNNWIIFQIKNFEYLICLSSSLGLRAFHDLVPKFLVFRDASSTESTSMCFYVLLMPII